MFFIAIEISRWHSQRARERAKEREGERATNRNIENNFESMLKHRLDRKNVMWLKIATGLHIVDRESWLFSIDDLTVYTYFIWRCGCIGWHIYIQMSYILTATRRPVEMNDCECIDGRQRSMIMWYANTLMKIEQNHREVQITALPKWRENVFGCDEKWPHRICLVCEDTVHPAGQCDKIRTILFSDD